MQKSCFACPGFSEDQAVPFVLYPYIRKMKTGIRVLKGNIGTG
jgi:hypothetical protein